MISAADSWFLFLDVLASHVPHLQLSRRGQLSLMRWIQSRLELDITAGAAVIWPQSTSAAIWPHLESCLPSEAWCHTDLYSFGCVLYIRNELTWRQRSEKECCRQTLGCWLRQRKGDTTVGPGHSDSSSILQGNNGRGISTLSQCTVWNFSFVIVLT